MAHRISWRVPIRQDMSHKKPMRNEGSAPKSRNRHRNADALHTRVCQSVCSRERSGIRRAKPRADAACGSGRAPDLQRAAQVSTLYCPLKERRDELRPLTSLARLRLVAARRHTDTGTPRWLKVSTSAPFMPDACGRCLRRVPDSRHACPCMSHASTVCV